MRCVYGSYFEVVCSIFTPFVSFVYAQGLVAPSFPPGPLWTEPALSTLLSALRTATLLAQPEPSRTEPSRAEPSRNEPRLAENLVEALWLEPSLNL